MKMRVALTTLLLAIVAGALTAGVALASPGKAQYQTPTVKTATHAVGNGGVKAATAAKAKSGTLPFTGQSLIWFVVAGVALVMVGLMLRRRARRDIG
jgi:LPXTG-motif cell wall-anchored protein